MFCDGSKDPEPKERYHKPSTVSITVPSSIHLASIILSFNDVCSLLPHAPSCFSRPLQDWEGAEVRLLICLRRVLKLEIILEVADLNALAAAQRS